MVEVKVIASTAGAWLAGVAIALLNGVVADSSLLGGLPPWLQFIILMAATPTIAFLTGYAKSSQTSSVSDSYNGKLSS